MAKKPKAVWMLSDGDYSDYHVIGIFSSYENAKKVSEKMGGSIDKMVLDPCVEEINAGLDQWHIIMRFDGTTENADKWFSSYDMKGSFQIWQRSKAPFYQRNGGGPDAIQATVWAHDEEHAVKIVNEWRIQAIADGRIKA